MVTVSGMTDVAAAAAATVAARVGGVGVTEEDTVTVAGGVARASVPAMGAVITDDSFAAHPSFPKK